MCVFVHKRGRERERKSLLARVYNCAECQRCCYRQHCYRQHPFFSWCLHVRVCVYIYIFICICSFKMVEGFKLLSTLFHNCRELLVCDEYRRSFEYMCVCVCMRMYVCMYVCMCVLFQRTEHKDAAATLMLEMGGVVAQCLTSTPMKVSHNLAVRVCACV